VSQDLNNHPFSASEFTKVHYTGLLSTRLSEFDEFDDAMSEVCPGDPLKCSSSTDYDLRCKLFGASGAYQAPTDFDFNVSDNSFYQALKL